jgi:chromosome segregation ATPase
MAYLLFFLSIGLGTALFLEIKQAKHRTKDHVLDRQRLQETDRQLKESNEHVEELDRRKQEADKQLEEANRQLKESNKNVEELDLKYGGIISRAGYVRDLDIQITDLTNQLQQLNRQARTEEQELSFKISLLRKRLQGLEEQEIVEALGFYESKYNFQEAQGYKQRLENIRAQQKHLIKDKQAAICNTEWSVEGSLKKGKKMTDDFIKLVLRAFNGECDASVVKVKYNNIQTMENRIRKAYGDLNKLSQTTHCEITSAFLELKLQELWLTHEYQERKYLEQEEQRIIRERMREEERALREIETAKQDAEKEEHRYQKALEKARRDLDMVTEEAQKTLLDQIEELQKHITEAETNKEENNFYQEALEKAHRDLETVTGEAQETLLNQIEELQKRLAEAEANKERAISQAQLTKSGHVYIISNIGSFGEDVYKIGMTRRLEPMDRVKELGGASVPFPFDVHAMIFCENAPELEARLHRYLGDRRVNKENTRKEFFQISLDEIVKTVQEIDRELEICKSEIIFTKIAEASDYRKTLARERQSSTDLN